LGCAVGAIDVHDGHVCAVQTDQGTIEAQAVICATPWEKAAKLLPEGDTRRQGLEALGHSPILGVHLLVDRQVMHRPHLILPGREIQWLFNKGMHDGRQHLHAVISAADDWMDRPQDEMQAGLLQELHRIMPALRTADAIEIRPIKARHATFRATPGAEAVRPAAGPGEDDVQGLYLAGDWCATGWPATMEGAVRSGHLAAQALLGRGAAGPVGPLATARLPRLLGLSR
jgi:predicted NAD/FAD-dependent oxidoreductase